MRGRSSSPSLLIVDCAQLVTVGADRGTVNYIAQAACTRFFRGFSWSIEVADCTKSCEALKQTVQESIDRRWKHEQRERRYNQAQSGYGY